jgi:glyoxylase-like metal-dependent hydrolase (beta-lactamase superfamily II)
VYLFSPCAEESYDSVVDQEPAGMKQQFDRRAILRAVVGAGGALFFPHAALLSQPSAAAALEVTRLGDALFMVSGAGCNVVVAEGPQGGATVVDGGLRERSAELLSLVRGELRGARIDTLFNTCWHPDRTGANEALGAAGARIMAHENTRLWLSRDVTRPWDGNRTIKRLPPQACPSSTFYEAGTVDVSGREVGYGYLLQAHTDGDIYVRFPAENVLVTGASITTATWPLLDWWTGGWIGGLVDAFDALLAVADERTRIVPGEGGVLTRAELAAQRQMYLTIFDRLSKLFFAGTEPEDMLAAEPTKEFEPRLGDSELFLRLAFRGFGLHFGPDA